MDKIRTFVAIDLDQAAQQRVDRLVNRLRDEDDNVRWVDSEQLHITLKFLGDVASVETPTICNTVAEAVRGFGGFSIRLTGVGAFPNLSRARTIWLGVGDGQDEVIELQERVENALLGLGYPRESRRFSPHITLGRVRRGGASQHALSERLQEATEQSVGEVKIGSVIVYASYLERSGPIYNSMKNATLA